MVCGIMVIVFFLLGAVNAAVITLQVKMAKGKSWCRSLSYF